MWPFRRRPRWLVPARGRDLSMLGEIHGIGRKYYFFGFFKEWDYFYRRRLLKNMRDKYAAIKNDPQAPIRLGEYFLNNGRQR